MNPVKLIPDTYSIDVVPIEELSEFVDKLEKAGE